MPKKKQTTTQNTTNSYGWQTPPDTADVRTLREWKPQEDPSIPYTFGEVRREQENAGHNPYGAYTTPAIRDATRQSANLEIGQREGQARRQGQFDVNQQEYGKDALIAGLTQPHLIQTGGTATGTSTQSGGFLGDLAVGVASGAAG